MNIINGVPITPPVVVPDRQPTVNPALYSTILFASVRPVSITSDALIIFKHTMFRAAKTGEIANTPAETPIPVKGYLEFNAFQYRDFGHINISINDFPFNFEIYNPSTGIYLLTKEGNLAFGTITGFPSIAVFLSFKDDGYTYSYSYTMLYSGGDAGKIQIRVMKNEAAANTLANAQFDIVVRAYCYINAVNP